VLRIKYDSEQRKFLGTPHYIIQDSFPGGGNHWVRSVKVGPDNKLYVSVGSSCNVCVENTPKRGAILQYDLDGKHEVIFARGLRNTTGFDWQPTTNLMYGVDIGRDYLGDETPPEELNQIKFGQHYGWPFEYGENIIDTDFTATRPSNLKTSAASHYMTAHSSPLDILFLEHSTRGLDNTALVTLHGSWNRSKKSGYKVILLSFTPGNKIEQRDFITGFEHDGTVTGRPVDLTEDRQGNIYLSDDYTGRIYKITPVKQN
jgi:glucose/arabinose dehydrogenase